MIALASKATTRDGKPVVLAFGEEGDGEVFCAWLMVEPTPGVDAEHVPLPAGPTIFRVARSVVDVREITLEWPGYSTGRVASKRERFAVILQETTENTPPAVVELEAQSGEQTQDQQTE